MGAVLGRPARRRVRAGRGRRPGAARLRRRAVRAARVGGGGAARPLPVATTPAREAVARRRVGGRGRGDARGRLGRPGGAGGRDGGDLGARGRRPRDVLGRARCGRARGRGRAPGARRGRRCMGAAEWSLSRGIHKDPIHVEFLGPERPGAGGVPRLRPGRRRPGRAPALPSSRPSGRSPRTWRSAPRAAKRAWLDGRPVALDGAGYLATGAVELPARPVRPRPAADARRRTSRALRAHFAFVADVDGYARPEWLRPATGGREELGRRVHRRASRCPPTRSSADVLVGANGPCRVLVDGREVGRQGGFDPYAEWDRDRLQPYDLARVAQRGRARAPARAALARPRSAGRAARRPRPHGGRDHRGALGRGWSVSVDGAEARARPPPRPARRPGLQPRLAATAPAPGGRLARARARDRGRGRARDGHRRPRHGVPSGCASSRHPAPREICVPLAPGCRGEVTVGGRRVERAAGGDGELRAALGGGARPARRARSRSSRRRASPAAPSSPARSPSPSDRGAWSSSTGRTAGLVNHSGGVRYRRRLDLGRSTASR